MKKTCTLLECTKRGTYSALLYFQLCKQLNNFEFHKQINRHLALFRQGQDYKGKDKVQGFKDLGIQVFRVWDLGFGIWDLGVKKFRDLWMYGFRDSVI